MISIDEFLLAPWSLGVEELEEEFSEDTIAGLAGNDKIKLDDVTNTLIIGNKFIRDYINDDVTLEKRKLLDDEEYDEDEYEDEYEDEDEYEHEYDEDEMETDEEDLDDEKFDAWFQ